MHLKFSPTLYGITDKDLTPGSQLMDKVEQALRGGCQWIQYRDKSLEHARRLHEAMALRDLCDRFRAQLIINDDVDLAEKSKADGVHLGQQDMSIAEARARLGSQAIIGATCHNSSALANQSYAAGASYLAFGRFFPSQTKPEAGIAPLALLMEIKQSIPLPIVAIGGINHQNAAQVFSQGADTIAVCQGLFDTVSIEETAKFFIQCKQKLSN